MSPRIGVVCEPLANESLIAIMDWLVADVPEITDLEVGTGGYAPANHCDMPLLVKDKAARRAWLQEITARDLRLAALNVWGNPLHPDLNVSGKHDSDLRDTICLAAELGVDRIVAMAGCPAASPEDRTPHFSGGGWLPYLENIYPQQWDNRIADYWSTLGDFSQKLYPDLMICLELHPGTVAYNVATFERLSALSPAIAANLDPSHFIWMQMDAHKIVQRLGSRIGHAHGKDTVFQSEQLALNGLLDNRWPKPPEDMPWNFATVGHGKDAAWWGTLLKDLKAAGKVATIAIEHEDPFVPPRQGIAEAARLLKEVMPA